MEKQYKLTVEGCEMSYFNSKHFPSNKHFYLTKEGLDNLKSKLDDLREERLSVYNHLKDMDPNDRLDYILTTDTIKMLEINEVEIKKINNILQHADTVMKSMNNTDVKIGSTVSLNFGSQTIKYTLVDPIEADPSTCRISEESPLGKALIGKKPHEKVHFLAPKGKIITCEVEAII